MIIKLENAILHIANQNSPIFSFVELDLTDASINQYLISQIEKEYADAALRTGSFNENSAFLNQFKQYLNNEVNFVSFSEFFARQINNTIFATDKPPADVSVIICQYTVNDTTIIALLKYENKIKYTHSTVKNGEKLENRLNETAIFPAKPSETAFIQKDFNIKYRSKKYTVDGEKVDILAEDILECTCETVSSKEVIKSVVKQIKKISPDALKSLVNMKQYITQSVKEQHDKQEKQYDLEELSEHIFDNVSDRQEFIENNIKANIIHSADDILPIDDYIIKETNKKIGLVLDNGIEIKVPANLMYQEDTVSIERDNDGQLNISIRNIAEMNVK